MYKRIMIFVTFIYLSLLSEQQNFEKQLRLHFDINKTIIAMDVVQGKDLAETINGILAEFTFGLWDGKQEQSYYAYVTDQLVVAHPELSRVDELFKAKRRELLKEFPIFLEQYPSLLIQYKIDQARMLAILSEHEMVIFPSFFKAIIWLEHNYLDRYAIYLRTFGQDLPEVIPAIEQACCIRFAAQGKFEGKKFSLVESEEDLYEFFAGQDSQHYAVRDDYRYWQSCGYQAVGGKIFPVDITNSSIISIFFDDNANDPDKPIICPVDANYNLQDTDELLIQGNIVAVDPKQAILDEDYFINKIKAIMQEN